MLEIVKASAGSGKTFMLAGKYIQMLFKDSSYAYTNYKTILAVTFTNKATAEMKERILKELFLLSVNPDKSKYIGDLLKLPLVVRNGKGNPKEFVKNHSSNLLISILNDYSFFNVSTIDRFLQRVMRAFAREIGQFSSYNVELEHSDVLSFAVDMLMNSVDDNPVLLDRLVKLSKFQMEEGKSWDITSTLISLSQELFQEKFKILKKEIGGNLPSHQEIAGLSSGTGKVTFWEIGTMGAKAASKITITSRPAMMEIRVVFFILRSSFRYQIKKPAWIRASVAPSPEPRCCGSLS